MAFAVDTAGESTFAGTPDTGSIRKVSDRRQFIPNVSHMENKFICLLIDDDADDREIFLSVIDGLGASVQCVTAINGQEAIQKLVTREVEPDLIFVDLNMPLMNGKQFLRECNALQLCKNIPIVILTTTSDHQTIEETRQLGATDCITKPDRLDEWNRIIREKINSFRSAPKS